MKIFKGFGYSRYYKPEETWRSSVVDAKERKVIKL
jgi:hypothetical protein